MPRDSDETKYTRLACARWLAAGLCCSAAFYANAQRRCDAFGNTGGGAFTLGARVRRRTLCVLLVLK